MNRKAPENSESECARANDGVLVIHDSQKGQIVLPRDVYDLIEQDLSECLRRGDDDRCLTAHLQSCPLRTEDGHQVTLQTRNLQLILWLLIKHKVKYELRYSFESRACSKRCETLDPTLLGNWRIDWTPFPKLGDFVDGNRSGLIVSRDQRQTFDAIAALCCWFRESPIALVVASQAEADLVSSEIRKRITETIRTANGFTANVESRISVPTYHAFRSMWYWDVPFVIVPIWRANYPLWMKQLTLSPYLDRVYFFRTVNQVLSDRVADDFEGRVGPSFSLVDQRLDQRKLRYFSTYEFGGTGSENGRRNLIGISSGTINHHKLYWTHRTRNQAVAALARELAETCRSVAILCENLIHAEALSRLLDGWTLVKKGQLPEKMPDRTIVTLTAADSWDKFCPETVVVASGGSPSPWLIDWGERMSQSGTAVRVIDLTDGFDDTANRLAAARLKSYRDSNWHWRPLPNSVVRAVGRAIRSSQKSQD
jgi:hypothetical protein